jgi:hypothetical protein
MKIYKDKKCLQRHNAREEQEKMIKKETLLLKK